MLLTLIMTPPVTDIPLVITLKIDEPSQLFFDKQRTAHFPPHANYVPAHITLFHKLPSDNPVIENGLATFAKHPAFELLITDIMLHNASVAYSIQSDALQKLHAQMQQTFAPYLIRNDRKILTPHITIQNKVTAFKAYKTHALLLADFKPFVVQALGYTSWYYVKGYWEKKEEYFFR